MINDKNFLDKRNKLLNGRNIVELMEGLINYKLLYVLYKSANLDVNSTYDELSGSDKDKLYKIIKSFTLDIIGTKDFSEAQICCGGIPLTEINLKTMESLKQKGLYITGELQDVDGDCGGYNLGYAWLSGIIAGNNI
jgi:predicted flavoprotein YhiN